MKENINRREHVKKHVNNRLQIQLRLYVLIAIIMGLIVIYDLFTGHLSLLFTVLGILVGLVIGIISSRMFHISWDHDAKKVISQVDTIGVIVIIGYVLFEIGREYVFKHYIDSTLTGALTFAFIYDMLSGRVIGTR